MYISVYAASYNIDMASLLAPKHPMPILMMIGGAIPPKPRPRFANGRAYLPAAYRKWKDLLVRQMRSQRGDAPPLKGPLNIAIHLTGKHSRRGDLDNTAGAILDVAVQGGLIEGDNMRQICGLLVTLDHSPDVAMAYVEIRHESEKPGCHHTSILEYTPAGQP